MTTSPHPRFRPARSASCAAATLVELLASMAILGLLLVILGTALQGALGRFRSGVDRAEARGGAEAALRRLERDLASAIPSRPANRPRLPDDVTEAQRRFFEGRVLFPFEVDRREGRGLDRSFPNAAEEFDSLAFVGRPAPAARFDPAREAARLSGETIDVESAAASEGARVRPALLGYYVAYTRDSPLTDFDGASMKLYRHHRPGGGILAEGYADGFLLHCSHRINDASDESGIGSARDLEVSDPAAVPNARFDNAELPFLLSRHVTDRRTFQSRPATAAWPALPLPAHLDAPPPTLAPHRGSAADWLDPTSPVHDTVFPDEPLCSNVVRFELTPLCRVALPGGRRALMDAAELNDHLQLANGDEWPCLVAPDFLDVVLGVVDEGTARRLTRYEDWIVDWSAADPASRSPARRRIEEGLRTYRFRIALSRRFR